MTATLAIDPRMWISAPYDTCPKCKKADSFGLIGVNNRSYSKRCRECLHSENYPLPPLTKKIIYLDQFAISNMAKALSKKLGNRDTEDKFWLRLFEKLDRLVKLQLIICPSSLFHREESLFYESEAQRQMYEHLGDGASFRDAVTIRRFQTADYFRQYLSGVKKPKLDLDPHDVITGEIDDWQNTLRVSVTFRTDPNEVTEMRDAREKTTAALENVVGQWRSERGKPFKFWFDREALAYGEVLARTYWASIVKLATTDPAKMTPDEMISLALGEGGVLMTNLMRAFPDTDEPAEIQGNYESIYRFLTSEHMKELPFNRIRAGLWASLANQVANGGRTKPVTSGMITDIDMLSMVVPYADVVLVDREMFGLYDHKDVRGEVESRFRTKVFSLADKDGFLDELNQIERAASKGHLRLVAKVYGRDWPNPYTTMYE